MNCIDICLIDVDVCGIDTEPFIQKVLAYLQIDNWDISVVFCSNEIIRGLNKKYRNKDEATDVLSFCQSEAADQFMYPIPNIDDCNGQNIAAGDIVISLQYLKQNVQRFCVSETEELYRLLVHGILHLNGMDHKTNDPTEEMLTLQEKILKVTLSPDNHSL